MVIANQDTRLSCSVGMWMGLDEDDGSKPGAGVVVRLKQGTLAVIEEHGDVVASVPEQSGRKLAPIHLPVGAVHAGTQVTGAYPIKEYGTVRELEGGLEHYFWFYNHERPHQALGYQTPAQVSLREGAAMHRLEGGESRAQLA
jgi:hypothetical protein